MSNCGGLGQVIRTQTHFGMRTLLQIIYSTVMDDDGQIHNFVINGGHASSSLFSQPIFND